MTRPPGPWRGSSAGGRIQVGGDAPATKADSGNLASARRSSLPHGLSLRGTGVELVHRVGKPSGEVSDLLGAELSALVQTPVASGSRVVQVIDEVFVDPSVEQPPVTR